MHTKEAQGRAIRPAPNQSGRGRRPRLLFHGKHVPVGTDVSSSHTFPSALHASRGSVKRIHGGTAETMPLDEKEGVMCADQCLSHLPPRWLLIIGGSSLLPSQPTTFAFELAATALPPSPLWLPSLRSFLPPPPHLPPSNRPHRFLSSLSLHLVLVHTLSKSHARCAVT